jgi:hypothetical protein
MAEPATGWNERGKRTTREEESREEGSREEGSREEEIKRVVRREDNAGGGVVGEGGINGARDGGGGEEAHVGTERGHDIYSRIKRALPPHTQPVARRPAPITH